MAKKMKSNLRAPFPWFGGKRKAAAEVWARFGPVSNYVEPFYGSGACLFARPEPFSGAETVNDRDGLVSNFWRALRGAPDEVAEWADWPVVENDLHARHAWLVGIKDTLAPRLEGDPEWYDAKVAGWWVWGLCCWIGSGFCSGKGPWVIENSRLVRLEGATGQGVKRNCVHLGSGRGVNRKRVHLGSGRLVPWFAALSERLARVRVCSGDWSRVCGPSVTFLHGLTGVFLDPPYTDTAGRHENIYRVDSSTVAHQVREWAIENGQRNDMRIALCGYEGEHEMPESWAIYAWSAGDGYGGQGAERTGNGRRERIWFSPACLSTRQGNLF